MSRAFKIFCISLAISAAHSNRAALSKFFFHSFCVSLLHLCVFGIDLSVCFVDHYSVPIDREASLSKLPFVLPKPLPELHNLCEHSTYNLILCWWSTFGKTPPETLCREASSAPLSQSVPPPSFIFSSSPCNLPHCQYRQCIIGTIWPI